MRIEVNKELLLNSIDIADSIITSKQVNTILSNCLLNVSKDEIEIISTDNEIGIRTRLEANSDAKGSFTIYGKKLSNILRELKDEVVIIDVSESYKVNIKTKSGKVKGQWTLIGTGKEEYPDIPSFVEDNSIEIEQPLLKELIRRVVYAAATDTIKPVFNGVYLLSEKKGKITAVATDSRRLSMTSMGLSNEIDLKEGVIVPLKTIHEISRLLSSTKVCSFNVKENQCFFKIGKTEIVSRIIDDKFPDYKQVIPKDFKIKAVLNKDSFLESLRRSMIFTKEPVNKIILNFKKNLLKIEANTPELGEAEEEIEIESNSKEEISLGINAQFLINAVREIDSYSIILGITGQMSPVAISPDGDEDYVSIVMPIQIKSS